MKLKVKSTETNLRIDKFLLLKLPDLSRSQIQKKIDNNEVIVYGKSIKKSYHTEENDQIKIEESAKTDHSRIIPVKMDLEILYEDEDIMVINKPPFIPVHPDNDLKHHKVTLVNILLGNGKQLSPLGGELRPGIVHRLDKDTSGLLIIAKTDLGYKHIRKQFENHQLEKTYLCLNTGFMESSRGRIEAPLARDPKDRKKMAVQTTKNAKNAISEFKTLNSYHSPIIDNKVINLLEVKIPTGRTHQIRVHFASIKHPLIGDTTYGNAKLNATARKLGLKRQFLHAYKLKFKIPSTGKSLTIKSELPKDLEEFLAKIDK
jgi:23S rRNA pseudouridine1911/1915/1917 synthase